MHTALNPSTSPKYTPKYTVEWPQFDLEQFKRDGFSVIRRFTNPADIHAIRAEWEQFHDEPRESLMTKDEPLVVFWRHVVGEKKKMRPISEFPAIKKLATNRVITDLVRKITGQQEIRLLETIIFSKPPMVSNTLNWHQDVAYFPFNPNNQIAVWFPLEQVWKETGALQYVVSSHKQGAMGSVDLHSGTGFANEDRPLIPKDPAAAGFEIHCAESVPGDMLIHDGFTWHCSGPNISADNQRRGLSLRYLVGDTTYMPRSGSAASFIGQVEVKPGDHIQGPAFPLV